MSRSFLASNSRMQQPLCRSQGPWRFCSPRHPKTREPRLSLCPLLCERMSSLQGHVVDPVLTPLIPVDSELHSNVAHVHRLLPCCVHLSLRLSIKLQKPCNLSSFPGLDLLVGSRLFQWSMAVRALNPATLPSHLFVIHTQLAGNTWIHIIAYPWLKIVFFARAFV